MKLWPATTENKCFVKMLWHLLSKYVKTIVLLVCPSSFFFFFSQSSICVLFSTVFFHYSYNIFHCSSIVLFWWATLSLIFKFWTVATISNDTIAIVATIFYLFIYFSLPFVLFFSFYIYCYTDTTNFTIFSQLLRCQFLIS